MSTDLVRSVCAYDCPDTCGLLVEVSGGHVVRVTGDSAHPITRGRLCPKMNGYERTVHSSLRLTRPALRTGPKGRGEFRPISWEEAIERIVSRWRELIAAWGSECILPYSYSGTIGLVQRNAGHPFFHKLGASRLDRTICASTKAAGWKAVMGDTPAMDLSEMAGSDLIVMWGANAAVTSIHAMHAAKEAKRQGARLWAIDTYITPTAQAADEAFVVRPGGDGALALGMLHVIVREGLHDRGFVEESTLGFDDLAKRILPECAPERMAPVCGLSARTIERMAREYAGARAPLIRLGYGLSRYGNGAMTVRTICCLPAVVGAWLRPGGGLFSSASTGAAFPVHALQREDFMRRPARVVNMNRLGEALNELRDPPIMGLYVYHSNPAAVAPDQNAVLLGLEREDLFTVVHERFMTDTARHADILLPATTSLEHPDLYCAYGSHCIQRCDAAIPPVGESKSNWDVFRLLAGALGWDDPFFRREAAEVVDWLIDRQSPWRDESANLRLRRGEPVLLSPPCDPKKDWKTPSGRIEIRNNHEKEPLPRLLPTHAEGDEFPLRLQLARTPQALNSSFYERTDLRSRQKCMVLMMSREDAETRGLSDGDPVMAYNGRGEVRFTLEVTARVPAGTVVSEGIWWIEFIDGLRGVNALTSQRLTDDGRGSTLYDVAVEVRRASGI